MERLVESFEYFISKKNKPVSSVKRNSKLNTRNNKGRINEMARIKNIDLSKIKAVDFFEKGSEWSFVGYTDDKKYNLNLTLRVMNSPTSKNEYKCIFEVVDYEFSELDGVEVVEMFGMNPDNENLYDVDYLDSMYVFDVVAEVMWDIVSELYKPEYVERVFDGDSIFSIDLDPKSKRQFYSMM